ncbi:hypothetical protein G3M54_00055 [Bacillus megaterium NBRC 15308 = ATCC 14581]|nr:hypothetical protein [Priestia megaterium NBRC 15308 = ATCC 14581]
MQLYKDRSLGVGERVRVYFNLHTHLFSIVSLEGQYKGKVVAHGNGIILTNAKFKVNRSGQMKVRDKAEECTRIYRWGFSGLTEEALSKRAYYNPYKTDYFINWESKENIFEADKVMLKDKRVTYL